MTVSRKRKRLIKVDGRDYLWWVVSDSDPPYVPSAGTSLKVVDAAGEMYVEYHLGQPPEVCHVVVQGKRFRSVRGCGGPHRRFRSPMFAVGPAVTPSDVAELIRWCESAGEPTEVNYLGVPLE